MDEDYSEKLQMYIDLGVVEVSGVDENGEIIYAIHESAQELAPELWEAHMDFVDKSLIELYEGGHMMVEYDENLEATISLSPEGLRIAKEKGILPVEMPEIPNN